MIHTAINFSDKFALISEYWSPKIVAQMNDTHFKLVKVMGDFVWHSHDDTDEVFIVLDGAMRIDLRDGSIELKPGEMYVVPRGVEHKPYAGGECRLLLVEPSGTVNTGESGGELTAGEGEWI